MPSTKLATILDVWYPSAQRLAVTLFILSALLVIILCSPASGDDLTGLSKDDPNDMAPASAQPQAQRQVETSSQSQDMEPAPLQSECAVRPQMQTQVMEPSYTMALAFQPLPSWSHGTGMPALPDALKPMGKKVVVETAPPTPAPLTPPKDATPAPEVTVAKPTPPPAPSPALIAVSPFLQWIQSNPQAAAQARQQAAAYAAGAGNAAPQVPAPNPNAPTANTPTGPAVDPYWLPPLIDTAPFGVQSTGGSSAAIYETPQR